MTDVYEDVAKQECSFAIRGLVTFNSHYEKHTDSFLKKGSIVIFDSTVLPFGIYSMKLQTCVHNCSYFHAFAMTLRI